MTAVAPDSVGKRDACAYWQVANCLGLTPVLELLYDEPGSYDSIKNMKYWEAINEALPMTALQGYALGCGTHDSSNHISPRVKCS